MLDYLDQRRFPLPANIADVDLALADKSINHLALTNRPDQNHVAGVQLSTVAEGRFDTGDALQVHLEIVRSAQNAGPIASIDPHLRSCPVMSKRETPDGRSRLHKD